jgi:A/G-specific adenine glycosylase
VAYATGRTAELPVRKPKKATPEKRALMLAVIDGGEVLLQQRPPTGIWGGLCSLPELDGHAAIETPAGDEGGAAQKASAFGEVEEVEALMPLVHVFTHYKLHIMPYRIALSSRGATPEGHLWWKLAEIADAPLPAPVKKLLSDFAAPKLF